MNLVNAQQASRVLDRIVGFKLSPVLWRKVKPALSAGRVQSVAVRLIVEREREVQKFKSEPYFRVNAIFALINESGNATEVKAELDKHYRRRSEQEAIEAHSCASFHYFYTAARGCPQAGLHRKPDHDDSTATLRKRTYHIHAYRQRQPVYFL